MGEKKVMCFKGGRGFGGQAGVRTSSNGLSERARQADGSGRDTQADRQNRALRSRSGCRTLTPGVASLGGIDAGWTSVAPEGSKRR